LVCGPPTTVPVTPDGWVQSSLLPLLVPALLRTGVAVVVRTWAPIWSVPGEGGGALTVTVAAALAEPPAPVQETEYAVVCAGDTEVEPESVPPVEKPPPLQEVAFVEFQVSVDDWPAAIEIGFAVRDAVGVDGGGGAAPQKDVSFGVPAS